MEFGDSKKIPVAVSEYVLLQMMQRCDANVLKVVADFSFQLKNASFDGWVLEADFFHQLRHSDSHNQLSLKSAKGPILLSYTSEVDKYFSDAVEDIWLIPQITNNGCFDLAIVYRNSDNQKVFRAINITRAVKHSLKLDFIHSKLNSLREFGVVIDLVEVIFVHPDSVDAPGISSIRGSLAEWNWTQKDIIFATFSRTSTSSTDFQRRNF